MAVLDPVKLTISNYPDDKTEHFELPNHPGNPDLGTRKVSFSKHLYIERADFMEVPVPKYHRLYPGNEVRLMGSYIVKCTDLIKDENGNVKEVICTADLDTGGKNPSDGRKIKGTIHWVNADDCVSSKARLYDRLFTIENVNEMPEDKTYADYLNKDSVKELPDIKIESSILDDDKDIRYQFVRNGYFIRDCHDPEVFNNIVNLKDSWAKENK